MVGVVSSVCGLATTTRAIDFRNLGKNPPAAVSLRSTPFSLGMHFLGISQAIHRPKVLKLLYLSIEWGERL